VEAWGVVGLLSALVGGAAGRLIKHPIAIVVGAAAAWCGLLAWLLYNEYFVPYQGGGASMWPIAQLFAGTFAAIVGGVSAGVVWALYRKPDSTHPSGNIGE
jgi:hypothetical protein